MKQQHNHSFFVLMLLVTFFFIGYQANHILELEFTYLERSLSPITIVAYLGLFAYIPLALYLVLYVPGQLVIRWSLRVPIFQQVILPTSWKQVTTSIVTMSFNRTISYQVFRC